MPVSPGTAQELTVEPAGSCVSAARMAGADLPWP